MDPLQNLTQLPGISSLGEAGKPAATGGDGANGLAFGDLLQKALQEVEPPSTPPTRRHRN